MSNHWFIMKDEKTAGPLATEEVQRRYNSGEISASALIWGPGMGEWRTMTWWIQELPAIAGVKSVEVEAPVLEMWYYALAGKQHGPLKRDTLLAELRHTEPLNEVLLWTKGMKEWAPLYEFHDMLNALGINKRIFPRADLHGKAVIKSGGNTLIAPLISISEGGLGIQLDSGVVPGQVVDVEIQSPVFQHALKARAEARYMSLGVVGLRFQNLNAETKGAILSFVRQSQTKFVLKAA